mgnify:CR=1 FL=1
MTVMYVLALFLLGGTLYMVSTDDTEYVVYPPAMSMDVFNKYVSFTVLIILIFRKKVKYN